MSDVAAIVWGAERGTPRAPGVREVLRVGSLDGVRDAARGAGAALVWVLWSGATASDATLPRLREHAGGPAASLPLVADGVAAEACVGRFTEDDTEALLAGVRRRAVPLRHTYALSMLVPAATVAAAPAPDTRRFGRYAGTVWTSQVLAREPGVLVPASTVLVGDFPSGGLADLARTARTGVWTRGERVRELLRLRGPRAS